MASSTASSVPSDHNAPLAVVNDNDHGAWVLICNAFGLTVVLITLIVRVYIRVKVSPPFGADDFVLAAATALAVVQVGVVFAQVDAGFGRSIDLLNQGELVTIQKVNVPSPTQDISDRIPAWLCGRPTIHIRSLRVEMLRCPFLQADISLEDKRTCRVDGAGILFGVLRGLDSGDCSSMRSGASVAVLS